MFIALGLHAITCIISAPTSWRPEGTVVSFLLLLVVLVLLVAGCALTIAAMALHQEDPEQRHWLQQQFSRTRSHFLGIPASKEKLNLAYLDTNIYI